MGTCACEYRIFTQNETREKGVVYPDVEVVVKANGTEICPDVTAAVTSCTPNIPRGLYNISNTQSNRQ